MTHNHDNHSVSCSEKLRGTAFHILSVNAMAYTALGKRAVKIISVNALAYTGPGKRAV